MTKPTPPAPPPPLDIYAPWILLAMRVAIGGVLAYSGFTKLLGPPEELAASMEGYRLLPVSATVLAARVLPWAELFAGAFLILGLFTRQAAAAASALFLAFVIALSSVLARGITIPDCGCFGRGGPHLEPAQALVLDAGLLAAALILFFWKSPPLFSLDAWAERKDAKN